MRLDSSGNQVEEGIYSVGLAAADSKGTSVTGAIYVTVSETRVEIGEDGAELVLGNGDHATPGRCTGCDGGVRERAPAS